MPDHPEVTDEELLALAQRASRGDRPQQHQAALWDLGRAVQRLRQERDEARVISREQYQRGEEWMPCSDELPEWLVAK